MAIETYAVDLPGKILYDEDFTVSVKKINPIQQKYLISLSQKQQITNKDYTDFVKQLIIFSTPTMTFEKLYWFDVKYLLYRLHFVTYAKYPIKLHYFCDGIDLETGKTCNNEIKLQLDMGDLVINTPDDIENRTDTITLDVLGPTKIRNKIIQDDIDIDAFIKKHNLLMDNATRSLLLDLCAISNGKSLQEMYTLAENGSVTAQDIVEIEKWFVTNTWGVKEEIKVHCPKCGREASREYELHLEDFFSAF